MFNNGENEVGLENSWLSVKVLDCLMRIPFQGPSIAEFDLQPGLNFWWAIALSMCKINFNDNDEGINLQSNRNAKITIQYK